MIRVLIVDDHSLMRVGIRTLMERQPDIEIAGEASEGAEAIQLTQTLQPDVITLDLGLPDQPGMQLIGTLKQVAPECRIVVFTATDDLETLRQVLRAGGHGYVVKMADIRDLIGAVRSVHAGRTFLNASFENDLTELFATNSASSTETVAEADPRLSERELEVLSYIALGYSNKQAANDLLLSVKTIETYRARLLKKLDLKDRPALVRYAIHHGLLAQGVV